MEAIYIQFESSKLFTTRDYQFSDKLIVHAENNF